jgi:hypothetical protein
MAENMENFILPDKEEHIKIKNYLENENIYDYIKNDNNIDIVNKEERESIKKLLGKIFVSYKGSQENISTVLDKCDHSFVSRKIETINNLLKKFSDGENIHPPIQVFFYHFIQEEERRRIGCHLVCSKTKSITFKNKIIDYSINIVPLEEANKKIHNKIEQVLENYRSFINRSWKSQWASSKEEEDCGHLPPFIDDQGMWLFRVDEFNTYLEFRHFHNLLMEQKHSLEAYERDSYNSVGRKYIKKVYSDGSWIPITCKDIVAGIIGDNARTKLHRMVLTSDAGIGKTTNLQWLNYNLNLKDSPKLAFLIDITDFSDDTNAFISNTLVSLLRKSKGNDEKFLSQEDAEDLLIQLRKEGRLVLLIDGWDQIQTEDRTCLRMLRHLLNSEQWEHCDIILGSRSYAIERDWKLLFEGTASSKWFFVQLDEFNQNQQELYLGSKRFEAIPRDYRNILSIPRVLYYLRMIDQENFNKIHTASDVYWFASSKLLEDGLRATYSKELFSNQARFLLSAIAFEMAMNGNFQEIKQGQMDEFLKLISKRCKAYNEEYTLDWSIKKLCQVAAMNEFVGYGFLEATCPQQIRWRNRSLQEFFAGLWITKYSSDADIGKLEKYIYLRNYHGSSDNQAYYWIWRFVAEMPEQICAPERWVRVMSLLYKPRDPVSNKVKRSNEMIYRSWGRMKQYAKQTNSLACKAITSFQTEFYEMCLGKYGPAAKRIAKQLLSEFRPIPKKYEKLGDLVFWMGSSKEEKGHLDNEHLHKTSIQSPFELTCYLITAEQYALFDPAHIPWQKRRKSMRRYPVTCVNWYDAWVFSRWMGDKYYLPTEKEWEFACRASSQTAYYFSDCLDLKYVRCEVLGGDWRKALIPVGCLKSNAWGLYDMHGLVWEWCENWYNDNPEIADDKNFIGTYRVLRGGSCYQKARNVRSAVRRCGKPEGERSVGFRIARVAKFPIQAYQ